MNLFVSFNGLKGGHRVAADCQKTVDSRYTKFRVTFPFIPPECVHKKVVLNGQTQHVCGITCGEAWTISRAGGSIVLNLSPTEQELASGDVAVVKPYYKKKATMECRGRHITFDEQMVVVEIQRADERIVSFLCMTTSPSTADLSTKKRKGKPARQARKPKGHKGRHVKDRDGDATDVSSPLTIDAEDVEDATGELVTVLNESEVNQLEFDTLKLPEFGLSQEEWKMLVGTPPDNFNGVVGSGGGTVDKLVALIQERIAIGKHEPLRA